MSITKTGLSRSLTMVKRCLSAILRETIPAFLASMLESCITAVNRLTRSLRGRRRIPVFDLVNAGPRHRFACSDVVVSNCAADYGLGFDKNVMLETRYGLPIVQIQLCHQNALLNYSPALGHPRWMVDKTTALDILFMSIKYGKIRFPPQSEFAIYTDDLLSPYEEVNDTGEFAHRRYVRDPSRPDDFAMALCFGAMLAMKLSHSSIMDMVPRNAGAPATGKPEYAPLDPAEILRALSS